MKYSREQVKAMSPKQYQETICRELNDAGFTQDFHGDRVKYEPSEWVFGGGIVFDVNAVNYLKKLGLVNNGKCPQCGIQEDEIDYRLQHQSGADYHVCKKCYKELASQERQKRGCGCCLLGIIVIAGIIYGLIKLLS